MLPCFTILAVGMFVPYSLFDALPAAARVLAGATLAGLPVFFSGLIFSRSFRDVAQPAQGLGINLLGAVLGGVLENLVMIGGTPILGIMHFSSTVYRQPSCPDSLRCQGLQQVLRERH